jgi:predicted dehydrogenase
MNDELQIVRWGIMGTARIATRVSTAIHAVAGAEAGVIASRNGEKAASWGAEHDIPQSTEGYQALLENDQLDAIYIPLPPSMHHEWTIKAAEHGKHVLCEKPIAMNARQAEEMAAACRENNVQLMDSTMWVHSPRARDMKQFLASGQLGELSRVTSAFTIMLNPIEDELRYDRQRGGGSLMDLGWYNIRATLWAFGSLPERVLGSGQYENDVDMRFSATLWYPGDAMASFDCAFNLTRRKWFEITGTEGTVVCDDFLAPWDPARPRYWTHDAEGASTEYVSEPLIQEECMVDHFCQIVRSGELDEHWPQITIDNQRVVDALDQSSRSGKVVEIAHSSSP